MTEVFLKSGAALGVAAILVACGDLKSGSAIPFVPDAGATDAGADATPADAGCEEDAADFLAGFSPWYTLPSIDIPVTASVTGAPASPSTLVLFAVDSSGTLRTTRASAPIGAESWSPWTPADGGAPQFTAGAPVTAVARGDGVDLYGISGGAVETYQAGASTWGSIGDGSLLFPPQPVAAVARDAVHSHVLAISNGSVYESHAGYDEDAGPGSGAFSDWAPIGGPGPLFPDGNMVIVLARPTPDSLDAFALASDNRVYDSSRSFAPTDTGWGPWIPTGDPQWYFPAGSALSVVDFKDHAEVDLLAVGANFLIFFGLRNDDWYGGEWWGWSPTGPGFGVARSHIAAVAGTWSADLFSIEGDEDGSATQGPVQGFSWHSDMNGNLYPGPTAWETVPSRCSGAFPATSVQAFVAAGVEQLVAVDALGFVHGTSRQVPD